MIRKDNDGGSDGSEVHLKYGRLHGSPLCVHFPNLFYLKACETSLMNFHVIRTASPSTHIISQPFHSKVPCSFAI